MIHWQVGSLQCQVAFFIHIQGATSTQKVACAAGVFSLAGSETCNMDDDLDLGNSQEVIKVTDVRKSLLVYENY